MACGASSDCRGVQLERRADVDCKRCLAALRRHDKETHGDKKESCSADEPTQ